MKARDVGGAIALAEGAVARRVFLAVPGALMGELPATNAFGQPVAVERGDDVGALVQRMAASSAGGERVALVANARDLAGARAHLARLAEHRLDAVVHVLVEKDGTGEPALSAALSLAELPWGMLVPSGVVEALDLALVARRAAEDSGCPFFVVHDQPSAHHVEALAPISPELCTSFLGPARPGTAPGDARAVAERVPFALASALREFEALTARKHDVLERAPNADASLALVGLGHVGDTLAAEAERLRGVGQDVAAVRVVAFRPFPGARLVKALGRTLAVSVVESIDRPLAAGGPLAVELKASFSDAITWAPGFPGIGRVPRVATGVLAPGRALEPGDVEAMVANMHADERGLRAFVLGGGHGRTLPASTAPRHAASTGFAALALATSQPVALATADLCAAVLASTLGARTRVDVRPRAPEDGGGFAVDLVASLERPRGAHAPHSAQVVAVQDPVHLTEGNPLSRMAEGGLLAVPSAERAAEHLWSTIPPCVKAVAHDRHARVVGWRPGSGGESPWAAAAAFAGIVLAGAAADKNLARGRRIEGTAVAREVAEALRRAGGDAAAHAQVGGELAREAFEAHVEVPRATVEREDDGVRLGRRDSRSVS